MSLSQTLSFIRLFPSPLLTYPSAGAFISAKWKEGSTGSFVYGDQTVQYIEIEILSVSAINFNVSILPGPGFGYLETLPFQYSAINCMDEGAPSELANTRLLRTSITMPIRTVESVSSPVEGTHEVAIGIYAAKLLPGAEVHSDDQVSEVLLGSVSVVQGSGVVEDAGIFSWRYDRDHLESDESSPCVWRFDFRFDIGEIELDKISEDEYSAFYYFPGTCEVTSEGPCGPIIPTSGPRSVNVSISLLRADEKWTATITFIMNGIECFYVPDNSVVAARFEKSGSRFGSYTLVEKVSGIVYEDNQEGTDPFSGNPWHDYVKQEILENTLTFSVGYQGED